LSIKHVALVGAHGVGKTTLINSLRAHYIEEGLISIHTTPEIPREICERAGDPEFFRRGVNEPLRQALILFGQATEDRTVISKSEGLLISDRSVIDHWAYTTCLFEAEFKAASVFEHFEKMVVDYSKCYDALFYIGIEFPPRDDGTRESDADFQLDIDRRIRATLKRSAFSYTTLKGSVEERRDAFISGLDNESRVNK